MFQTKEEDVQTALEADSWFNDRFFLKETIDEQKEAEKQRLAEKAAKKAAKKKAQQMEKMTFASVSDAKKYFVEKYEVSRTMLRSKAEIMEFAKAQGISLAIGKAAMDATEDDAADAGTDNEATEDEETSEENVAEDEDDAEENEDEDPEDAEEE